MQRTRAVTAVDFTHSLLSAVVCTSSETNVGDVNDKASAEE
jgi:hypothetical protein